MIRVLVRFGRTAHNFYTHRRQDLQMYSFIPKIRFCFRARDMKEHSDPGRERMMCSLHCKHKELE